MAIVQIVSAAVFDAIFANRQRAVVLDAPLELVPGDLVELTDGKRRCQRLTTDVAPVELPHARGLRLVSLRPLTNAERVNRTTGEDPA